jgi:hypothetical protein
MQKERIEVMPRQTKQFNSTLAYLRANLTYQKTITKLARLHRKEQQKAYKQNINTAV